MNSPTTALAWEFWRRNQRHLLGTAGILLFFILAYPKLCVLAGFNPNSRDAADEFARQLAANVGQLTVTDIIRVLLLALVTGGPAVVMVMTLIGLTSLFTFSRLNFKTKDLQTLHGRLFTLPVSTSFLFWRLQLGGVAAVLALCAIWDYGVPLPRFAMFAVFQNGFAWATLLVLGQAIVWSLAAWPWTQVLALTAVGIGFLLSSGYRQIMQSLFVLPPLFLLGMAMARVGLEKLRHGEWRGEDWKWPFSKLAARIHFKLRSWPSRFASPAQAQCWFEWSRFVLGMSYVTILLAVVPLMIFLAHRLAGWGPLSPEAMKGFSTFLIYMPPLLFLLLGLGLGVQFSQDGPEQRFLLVRPITSGDMVMALMKGMAIGTVLTWAGVGAALAVMPFFGDFSAVEHALSPQPGFRVVVIVGLIFLTWRMAVINLCFALTGNRWLSNAPVFLPLLFWTLIAVFHSALDPNAVVRNWLVSHGSGLLIGLLILKFLLAGLAFRACLRRRLLSPSGVAHYLIVWSLMVATLLAILLILGRPPEDIVATACLVVLLLVPLSRIGFAPLALAKSRHLGGPGRSRE
jgi:hypothetical protein